jgi:hypothetical protein
MMSIFMRAALALGAKNPLQQSDEREWKTIYRDLRKRNQDESSHPAPLVLF